MNWVNLTGHEITIECASPEQGGFPTRITIQPSGMIARCEEILTGETVFSGLVEVSDLGPVQGLPEPVEGTNYIVSGIVLGQCRGRKDVYAPDSGVTAIKDKGRVICVTRLRRAPR